MLGRVHQRWRARRIVCLQHGNACRLKSTDCGKSWASIAGDLPTRHVVWSIVEDHENEDLLFAGTEFGLFFTVDGGRRWVQLRGGAPTAQFRDLTIQRRENDLVAATFGRGLFVLDDYTPLRYLTNEALAGEGRLFPPRRTRVYDELRQVVAAHGNYTMDNPPFGAVLTYYLRDGMPKGEGSRIVLTIADSEGSPIAQVSGPTAAGLHRVTWGLRGKQPRDQGKRRDRQSGPRVQPGRYRVTLTKVDDDVETELGEPQTVEVIPLLEGSESDTRRQ